LQSGLGLHQTHVTYKTSLIITKHTDSYSIEMELTAN